MMAIHSFGVTIRQKNRTIVIPPRPAKNKAYNRYLRKISRASDAALVKQAVTERIMTGERRLETKIRKTTVKLEKKRK